MTLVEVLAAVVVCGAGIAVVAAALSSTVRGESYAGEVTRAADHADLVIARLGSLILPLEDARGDFEEDGSPDLRWAVEMGTTEVEALQSVTVTISWTSRGVERELTIERWIFVDPLLGGIR